MRTAIVTSLVMLIGVLAPISVLAKELPQWEFGAGVAPLYLPDYRGSNEYRGYLLPLPYVIYRGERFQFDRRGATGVLFESDRVELDLSANAANPSRGGKNQARSGMPDLKPTVELGPRLRVTLSQNETRTRRLTLELPVRAVFAVDFPRVDSAGLIFNPVLNLDLRDIAASGWNLGLQTGPVFGDRRYHSYYYAVDTPFARTDRPAYSARAGYGGTHFTIGASKRFKTTWFGAFVRTYALHGAVFDDSPLVKTRTAVLAGVGIAYVFAESSKRVEADE
jgi:MipA family protein